MNKIENIYVVNDYIEDIVNNTSNYDYSDILYTAKFTPFYKYKILNYLLLDSSISNQSEMYRICLLELDLYNEYVNDILNSDDDFLKSYVMLFLEPRLMSNDLEDNVKIANSIAKSKYSIYYKIPGLLKLSEYDIGSELTSALKALVERLIIKSKELDEKYDDKTKEELIMYYYALIDDNQQKYDKKLEYNKTEI